MLHVVCANVAREGMSKDVTSKFITLIEKHKLTSTDSSEARMCLRILVNAFSKECSRSVLMDFREKIIGDLNSLLEDSEGEISPQVSEDKGAGH